MPPAPTVSHYRYIDALRGLAFLGVLLSHVTLAVRDAAGGAPSHAFDLGLIGRFGVQLFFMASALTLFMSVSERRKRELHPTRNFFIRRLLRIGPLFWCGIVFYVWYYGRSPGYWAPHGIKPWQVIMTACFVHGWHPESINSVVPGGWSIGAEMFFYLLVPSLALAIRSLRGALWALVAAVVIALSVYASLTPGVLQRVFPNTPPPLPSNAVIYSLPLQLPIFAFGIVAYFVLRSDAVRQWLGQGRRAHVLLALVPVTLVLFACSPLNQSRSPSLLFLVGAIFFGLVVGLGVTPVRCLVNRPVCWLGTVSFSGYITHFAVLTLVIRHLPASAFSGLPSSLALLAYFLCLGAVALALTALVSALTHRWIEEPGIELGRRIIARWEAPAS